MIRALHRLVIGSAQFGMGYGVSSGYSQVPEREVASILELAQEAGITTIDTAFAYGEAETVLGRLLPKIGKFKIITKLPSLKSEQDNKSVSDKIDYFLNTSLSRLQIQKIDSLLVHNCQDLLDVHGHDIYEKLVDLKKQRKIQKIGVSVYETYEIEKLLSEFSFDIIQLPINLLDQRTLVDGTLKKLKNAKIEIHARSIFIQGLLLMKESELPASNSGVKEAFKFFKEKIKTTGLSPLQATLGFIKQTELIDYVVIGTHSRQQLQECIDNFSKTPYIEFTEFAYPDPEAIDPRRWIT